MKMKVPRHLIVVVLLTHLLYATGRVSAAKTLDTCLTKNPTIVGKQDPEKDPKLIYFDDSELIEQNYGGGSEGALTNGFFACEYFAIGLMTTLQMFSNHEGASDNVKVLNEVGISQGNLTTSRWLETVFPFCFPPADTRSQNP